MGPANVPTKRRNSESAHPAITEQNSPFSITSVQRLIMSDYVIHLVVLCVEGVLPPKSAGNSHPRSGQVGDDDLIQPVTPMNRLMNPARDTRCFTKVIVRQMHWSDEQYRWRFVSERKYN